MNLKKRLVIATTAGLLLSGAAAGAVAAVTLGHYTTQSTYTMIFGSSGNISSPAGGVGVGTVGSVLPGQCELYGVGDFIGSTPCPTLLATPYELTETPISSSSGVLTYLTVTTTNAAPSTGGNLIVFSVRLCENGANNCNVPPGGITTLHCTPAPGSKTCSAIGKVVFNQWQPKTFNSDPAIRDEGLIDLVASRGCSKTCPNGTYDPGHVSWSVAYIK